MVKGNVKALIPLMREKLVLEGGETTRYRRGERVPIGEKRIFGVLTRH